MEIFKPPYYDSFHCLAGRCADSCCQDWEVEVDGAAAHRYRRLPGSLGEDLRKSLSFREGRAVLENHHGRCPMLRPDGLCRIQAELGEEALCQTCRLFPRLRHDYGAFVELGLELSCPEAARLILAAPVWEAPCPKVADPALTLLLSTRREALSLIRSRPMPQALALLLFFGCHVQQRLDGETPEPFDPQAALTAARSLAVTGGEGALVSFFRTLEALTRRWPDRLASPSPAPWQEGHRALLGYFIHRYWLQAFSDGDLYGRVKLAIASCLLICHLGGDLTATAQLYSKEIENDPDNIEAILDAAYHHSALSDHRLLGMAFPTGEGGSPEG